MLMGAARLMYASMLSSVALLRTADCVSAAALPELFLGAACSSAASGPAAAASCRRCLLCCAPACQQHTAFVLLLKGIPQARLPWCAKELALGEESCTCSPLSEGHFSKSTVRIRGPWEEHGSAERQQSAVQP